MSFWVLVWVLLVLVESSSDLSATFSESAKSEYDGSFVLLHHLGNYHHDEFDDNDEDGDDLDAETEGQG